LITGPRLHRPPQRRARPGRGGRGRRAPPGPLHPGARDRAQAHRRLHHQRHCQAFARARPDCGRRRRHRSPGANDPQSGQQAEETGL